MGPNLSLRVEWMIIDALLVYVLSFVAMLCSDRQPVRPSIH